MKKYFLMRGSIAAAWFLAVLFLCQWTATEAREPTNRQSGNSPSQPLVLSNVKIIDGRGGKPRVGQTVVIRDGRIAQIVAARRAPLPKGAKVLDLKGHYVIPGLIDSHVHLGSNRQELEKNLQFLFDGGITAVRDMGGDAGLYARVAPASNAGTSLLPRLHYSATFAGPSFWGDRRWKGSTGDHRPGEAPWALAITDGTDLTAALRQAKALGVTGIKVYSDLPPRLVRRITVEAHRQRLPVWSHPAVFPTRPADVVRAGVDVISHSALFVWEGVETLPSGFHVSPFTDFGPVGPYARIAAASPAILRVLDEMQRRGIILDATVSTTAPSTSPEGSAWAVRLTTAARRRGIAIAAGTDRDDARTADGYPTLFEEMEMLVEKVGLTPLEAITAATWNGARALRMETEFGSVEPGKLADLVILRADPTVDIRNARHIAYVIKEGNLYRPSRATR